MIDIPPTHVATFDVLDALGPRWERIGPISALGRAKAAGVVRGCSTS
jgi:hypothetical protein